MNALRFIPLSGGGNNRGFRVEGFGKTFFLKAYARHPGDKRNRLKTEFGFCSFVWKQGLTSIPRPLAKDEPVRFGLYEFIEGRLLTERDVTAVRVKEAVRFFLDLNKRRHTAAAKRLPSASEACFSIDAHLRLVSGRVARLRKIKSKGSEHRKAIRFIREELSPAWKSMARRVRREAKASGLSLCQKIRLKQRCLSPSDFGFHNAILTPKGRLRFIDFEYAGWDDPAKTVCDFALQPRLPFPRRLMPGFSGPVLKFFGDDKFLRERMRILAPVFALKWCCIILNAFLRDGRKEDLGPRLKKSKKYLRIALGGYGLR